MHSQKTIFAVDSHTAGEPLRLVVGGFPKLPGETMPEKRDYFQEHYDHLRRAIMQEPRGHGNMFGAVVTQPCNSRADLGLFFMHGDGYHNMCGHGTIATATIAVETGLVTVTEPETLIRLDTPAGLVIARVAVADGRAQRVTFQNTPAFLSEGDLQIDLPGYGTIDVDIAFGGNFFALVSAGQLGIDICPENAQQLREAAALVVAAANRNTKVSHPNLPHIDTVTEVVVHGPPKSPDAHMQNVVVFDGQIDRSPCGTGTCATLAAMIAKEQWEIGMDLVNESIINTAFIGRAISSTKVGRFDAIVPEITGSAHITGYSQLVINSDDPLKHGFVLP